MLITGSAIGDNRGVELERGTVRGYNAHTGELIWSWDPVPRDETDPHFSTWGKIAAERTGAANAWAPFSADEELGLVFVPTGARRRGDTLPACRGTCPKSIGCNLTPAWAVQT